MHHMMTISPILDFMKQFKKNSQATNCVQSLPRLSSDQTSQIYLHGFLHFWSVCPSQPIQISGEAAKHEMRSQRRFDVSELSTSTCVRKIKKKCTV